MCKVAASITLPHAVWCDRELVRLNNKSLKTSGAVTRIALPTIAVTQNAEVVLPWYPNGTT